MNYSSFVFSDPLPYGLAVRATVGDYVNTAIIVLWIISSLALLFIVGLKLFRFRTTALPKKYKVFGIVSLVTWLVCLGLYFISWRMVVYLFYLFQS